DEYAPARVRTDLPGPSTADLSPDGQNVCRADGDPVGGRYSCFAGDLAADVDRADERGECPCVGRNIPGRSHQHLSCRDGHPSPGSYPHPVHDCGWTSDDVEPPDPSDRRAY